MRIFDLLNTPLSGSARDWRVWQEKTKQERPLRWFFQKTIWEERVLRTYARAKAYATERVWAIRYRWHPKHQYHKINTGLAPGWHDPRTQILHGCFHTLIQFYDQQKTGHVDWQADMRHRQLWAEMTALNKWWTIERPRREALLPPLPTDGVLAADLMAVFDEAYSTYPEVVAWRKVAQIHHEMRQSWEQEDELMLVRLVKIRTALWD